MAVLERHDGKVPRRTEQLVRLPGVGRKTAAVVSGNAFGRREGIAVDTHVGRLTRRLGLSVETDPVRVERELMEIVPRSAWVEWSHLLIWHGRAICSSRAPRCPECVLLDLCPEGQIANPQAGTPPAHCVTDAARVRGLGSRAWIDSTSSSTPTASRGTRRGWPTSSRPRVCG